MHATAAEKRRLYLERSHESYTKLPILIETTLTQVLSPHPNYFILGCGWL
jgi:hypothetical protein